MSAPGRYCGKYKCPILTTSKWSLVRESPFASSKRKPAEYGAIPDATQLQSRLAYGLRFTASLSALVLYGGLLPNQAGATGLELPGMLPFAMQRPAPNGGSMLVLEEIKVMARIEEAVTLAKAPWMLGDRFVNKEVIEKKEQPALIYADRPEDLPA